MSAIVVDRDPRWSALERKTAVAKRHPANPGCSCATCLEEFPRERSIPRGDRRGMSELLLPMIAIAAPIEQPRAPIDRLKELTTEYVELLELMGPETWKSMRRPFFRMLRRVRRENARAPRSGGGS